MQQMRPAKITKAFLIDFERLEQASLELASQGWALQMSLTPAKIYKILTARSPKAVDAVFVNLYESNNGSFFNRVAKSLASRDVIAKWRPLLKQVFSAYRRRDFLITIPALLIACEGVLASDRGNETNVKKVVADCVQAQKHREPDSITFLVWRTVERFINELFKNSDFTGARPSVLNRHWILHGRDSSTWTQADCLRLIQVVDTLSYLRERSNKRSS